MDWGVRKLKYLANANLGNIDKKLKMMSNYSAYFQTPSVGNIPNFLYWIV